MATPELPESVRAAASTAGSVIGGAHRRLGRWADPREENSVHIITCEEAPSPGLTTYSTVSLHQHPNLLDGKDTRVELAGVADSRVLEFPNALSTAAFYVIKDHWLAAPGVVFPGILLDYDLGTDMEHLMWAPPFPWDELGRVNLGELIAHWLIAVPIYESERRFLLERGYFEFENFLEERDVPYYDLSRPPAV